MIEAVPEGFFPSHYRLVQPHGTVGGLRVPGWSADAECLTAEGEFRLYRAEAFSGDFVLERDGEIVARAVKPVLFWPRFDVQIGSRTFMLDRSWRRGTFTLYEDGRQLGSVKRGVLTRRVYIDLPQHLPLPAQVFVFWLVLVIWARDRFVR